MTEREDFDLNHPHGFITSEEGWPVRELCRDALGPYPIIGILHHRREEGEVHRWTLDGVARAGSHLDLINAPAPKRRVKGYVAIFHLGDHWRSVGMKVQSSPEDAITQARSSMADMIDYDDDDEIIAIPIDHEIEE